MSENDPANLYALVKHFTLESASTQIPGECSEFVDIL